MSLADQIKAAEAPDAPVPFRTGTLGEAQLRDQQSTGRPALSDAPPLRLERESLAFRRNALRQVLADGRDPFFGSVPVVAGVPDLPPDAELVVEVCCALALQPRDLGFEAGFLNEPRITRGNGLGERELVGLMVRVFERADAAVAREGRGDEPSLALVGLPHRGVHRTQCGVCVDLDLAVLVALPLDAPFPLFDLRREPGHVEMVQGL